MALGALGRSELLLLVLFAGGPIDLVSVTPTKAYFTYRKLEQTPERLMELAGKEPIDSQVHFRQLMALKTLAEDVDGLKKSARFAEHRTAIENIAAGKRGQDPAGFAKVYAERLLLALDGKSARPAEDIWNHENDLKALPASVVQLGVCNIRPTVPRNIDPLLQKIEQRMRDDERELFCDVVEKLGNVQFDGVTFGFAPPRDMEDGPRHAEVYIRARGKFNHAWLSAGLATLLKAETAGAKVPGKEKISFIKAHNADPEIPQEIALVDDHFVFVANFARPHADASLVEPFLDVHFGKKPNATKGPLADLLRKIPGKTELAVVGRPPERWAPNLKAVLVHMVDTPQGKDTQATWTLQDDKTGDDLLASINKGKQVGLAWLKMLQETAPPDVAVADFQVALESLQAQKQGNIVTGRFLLPGRCIRSLPHLLMFADDP